MLGIVISTRQRVFGLDLLRAFAIFCVVHRHGKHLIYGTKLDWLANMPLPHGVDLFFVLSGFLIGLSVMRMAAREDKWHQTWRFYGKTALRILPNYYALLLVNLLLVSLGVINADLHATPMYQYITLTQNLFTPFYGFYWESWSVPIQWWFYIFFPLLVIAVRRVSGRYAVPVVVVLAVAGSLLFRALTCMGVDDPYHYDILVRKTLASRTDSIYMGVLAAWVCREFPDFWQRCRWWALGAGVALFVAERSIGYSLGDFYSIVVLPIMVPIAVALSLPALNSWRTAKGKMAKAIMVVSLLSYSMFMINLIAAYIIDGPMQEFSKAHGEAAYGLFWLMVVVGTFLLYYVVERPAMSLRERLFMMSPKAVDKGE